MYENRENPVKTSERNGVIWSLEPQLLQTSQKWIKCCPEADIK